MQTSTQSVFTRFAIQVQQGKFSGKTHEVLLDLVKAVVEKEDRISQGVGLQNFKYGSALHEFAHICAIMSPELYRQLRHHLQLPEHRSLLYVHSSTQLDDNGEVLLLHDGHSEADIMVVLEVIVIHGGLYKAFASISRAQAAHVARSV